MNPSPDSPAARRVLLWGLVAIVVVLTALAGITVVRRTSGFLGRITGPPAPPSITQQLVVDRLQAVARLVASEMPRRHGLGDGLQPGDDELLRDARRRRRT